MKIFTPQTSRLKTAFSFFLKHLLIFCFCLFEQINISLAEELPVTPDGTSNTIIDHAANGTVVVNFAAPDENGTSKNYYKDFNVDERGMILNNAVNDVNNGVYTKIAGWIYDNPNLVNSGPASTILNEVTSNNITQIRGYIEIAGHKADLIIANPNGITINGGGFINTSKLTAIVGSSDQNDKNNLTFNLSTTNREIINGFLPKLIITGLGLSLESGDNKFREDVASENVTSTDLVAAIMNIVAPIYGGDNDVNLRTGDLSFNYLTKEVSSDNSNPTAPNQLAIDASALGKIQAGRIFIIATKEGFGIKYSADLLAQRGGINITANGDIEYNNVGSSKGDIEITSNKGSIKQNGIVQNTDAEGNVKINAFLNFTNNSKITAEKNLSIKAGNLLANYGIISSKKDLTLISQYGDINNYTNSEIIGGKGKTSFIAKKGTVNQNSLHSIIVNGDYSLDVENFVNTGKIDIAGNLTLNVSNNLVNEVGALIYSGGDMELNVVNNLTNKTRAVIYSEGNLTIQKYALANPLYNPSNNKINLFENISGKIISYGKDINISAINFKNYRSEDNLKTVISVKTDENQTWYEDKANYSERDQYNYDGPSHYGGTSFGNSGIDLSKNIIPHKTDLYVSFSDGWALQSYIERLNKYRRIDDLSNVTAVIQANNGKITINSDQFTNKSGEIYAAQNIDITASNFFKNINNPISYTVKYTCFASGGTCYIDRFNKDENGNFDGTYNLIATLGTGESYDYEENLASIPGIIKAGTNVRINSPQKTNNGSIEENVRPASYNDEGFTSLANDGIVNSKLDQYFNGPDVQGLFEKSTSPLEPLFETRSEFIDQSKFFASNYFYTRLGINLTDLNTQLQIQSQRMIGDQFFQNRILEEQLQTISKNNFLLSTNENNANNEIKSLIDNAADEYARLGLDLNKSLTQAQINSLQKDIIWYEVKIIDGASYIVPTIYLSQNTRNNLRNNDSRINNSVIYASGNINIDGGNFKNNDGSIIAKNQIDISASSIINQQNSLIASTQGSINLTASDKITNSNSKITAVDIDISAKNNVLNNNFSEISANNNLNITSLEGSIKNYSKLEAGNNMSLSAAQDVVNSATITTNAQNLIDSLNDAYIKLDSKHSTSGDLHSSLLETASISAGNLTINAGNNFNNYAANISTSGDTTIIAGNDINIETLELRNRSEKSWGHKSKGGYEITDVTRNIGSEIVVGGSLGLTSGSDTNIIGSLITAQDNDNVTQNNITINAVDNVNIVNAVNSNYREFGSHKEGMTRQSSSIQVDYNETAVSSKLKADNISISSGMDTLIQGSNVSTNNNLVIGSFTIAQDSSGNYLKDANGNYITTDNTVVGNLEIKDAQLREYHYADTQRGYSGIAATAMRVVPYTMMLPNAAFSFVNDQMSIFLPDSVEKLVMNTTPYGLASREFNNVQDDLNSVKIKESTHLTIDRTNSVASNVDVGGSMMTNSINNTTITGSNVNVAGNLLANAGGDFTIQNSYEAESISYENSYETAGKNHANLNLEHAKFKAGTIKEFNENGSTSSTNAVAMSNINIGGSTLIDSKQDFNLLASNLITTSLTEINSANDLNISDNKTTKKTSNYENKLTIDTGIQVGNAIVDAVQAVDDAAEAMEKVKASYDKLEKIKELKSEGKASDKAVERAQYQVTLALLNAGLTTVAAAQAAGSAAASSETLGFYGGAYVDLTKSKSTSSTELKQSIASNLVSGGSLSLTSGTGDVNVKGSNVISTNGDMDLTAMLGSVNINPGETTNSQESKFKSQSFGATVATNGASLSMGFAEGASSLDQTTFTNSQLLAQNGKLTINSKENTNVIGANLLAKDVELNVEGDLNVASKQNLLESDSYSYGMNFGLSANNKGGGGINGGFNNADAYQSRAWVDNQTSIIGTDSLKINVGDNTDIKGALIANASVIPAQAGIQGVNAGGGMIIDEDKSNLTLNTKTLTYSDLENYNNQESNSIAMNLSLGANPNKPTDPGNSQSYQNNEANNNSEANKGVVPGNLRIDLSQYSSESSSTSKATIGEGTITVGGIQTDNNINRDINNTETNKRDVLTSDFDATINIDTRLIVAAGAGIADLMGVDGAADVASNNLKSYVNDAKAGAEVLSDVIVGTNLSQYNPRKTKEDEKSSSQDAVPLTLPWLSRLVDENNNTKDKVSRETNDNPAPNLWIGRGAKPNTGLNLNDPANADCVASGACKVFLSDQGILRTPHDIIFGFRSASSFHDAGKYPTWSTQITIPAYFAVNYLGAVGTFFDAPNWNRNFVNPETNIFKGTFINQPEIK